MKTYIVLLRGINVGGKNKVPMARLRACLEELGFSDVSTYIASGNVVLRSDKGAVDMRARIEKALPAHFKLDNAVVKALVLDYKQLQDIVDNKPRGFGQKPGVYHSDAIFLMGVSATRARKAFTPREGVDTIWQGRGVIYSQRMSALRTKSRLNRVMASPLYKSMTIRNWNTTTQLLAIARRTSTHAGRNRTAHA